MSIMNIDINKVSLSKWLIEVGFIVLLIVRPDLAIKISLAMVVIGFILYFRPWKRAYKNKR